MNKIVLRLGDFEGCGDSYAVLSTLEGREKLRFFAKKIGLTDEHEAKFDACDPDLVSVTAVYIALKGGYHRDLKIVAFPCRFIQYVSIGYQLRSNLQCIHWLNDSAIYSERTITATQLKRYLRAVTEAKLKLSECHAPPAPVLKPVGVLEYVRRLAYAIVGRPFCA